MPFVSRAQARWGNSSVGRKALGNVAEWNKSTDFSKLPEKKQGSLGKHFTKAKDDGKQA